jgi:Kef-type K+ transport system membrane component KefB
MALACEAVNDVAAWCLLAFVIGANQATLSAAATTTALGIGYVVLMLTAVRAIVIRVLPIVERRVRADGGRLAIVVIGALASAVITEAIGIHAIVGAFLFGAIVPHRSWVASEVAGRVEDLARVLFLPAFFAVAGARAEIALLSSWADWAVTAGIVAVASLGKIGGAFAAARLSGIPRREAGVLGVLMNTRGLVELVVLSVGLEIGVIGPKLYTMLVAMALATTLMTAPLLDVISARGRR